MPKELKIKENYRRAKIIEKIIRQTWSSLESHLEYTHKHTSEGNKFHIDCCREYIDILNNVKELY